MFYPDGVWSDMVPVRLKKTRSKQIWKYRSRYF